MTSCSWFNSLSFSTVNTSDTESAALTEVTAVINESAAKLSNFFIRVSNNCQLSKNIQSAYVTQLLTCIALTLAQ